MIKKTLFLLLLLSAYYSRSQDKYELGSTLVSVNAFNFKSDYFSDRPAIEYANGLFFRWHVNRWAFRSQVSYLDYSSFYSNISYVADGWTAQQNNKEIRFGVGSQYQVIKNSQGLYLFADVVYRNSYLVGSSSGGFWGITENYTDVINGFYLQTGIGSMIHVTKHIVLSPEIGINYSAAQVREHRTPAYIGGSNTTTVYQTQLGFIPKLQLTVNF